MRNPLFGFVTIAALALSLFAAPVDAADDREVWKVGILWHAGNLEEEAVMAGPLTQGLRELGYVEGRNLILEHTFVDEKYELVSVHAHRNCSIARST